MRTNHFSKVSLLRRGHLAIPILLSMCPHLALAVSPFSVSQITDNAADDSSVQLNNNGWMAWNGSEGINLWDGTDPQVLANSLYAGPPQLSDNGRVAWAANGDIWARKGGESGHVNYIYDECSMPRINSSGTVVFKHTTTGYYWLGSRDYLDLLYPDGEVPVPGASARTISSFDINANGTVALLSYLRFSPSESAQYITIGKVSETYRVDVVDWASEISFSNPLINSSDHVVYKKTTPSPHLRFWDGTNSVSIPESVGVIGNDYDFNDAGSVVWAEGDGIYEWDGANTRALFDSTGGRYPQVNSRGHVVWRGENNNGIYYWNSQTTVQVSDMQGVSVPQFNERNEIAWTASDGNDTEVYLASTYAPPAPNTAPPEGHLTRPTGSTAKNAIVLVHGWNDSAALFTSSDGDPLKTDMKVNIEQALAANGRTGDWDVLVYDWSSDAQSPGLPFPPSPEVKASALKHGLNLANEIKAAGYDGHVHMVAHSLGSRVITTATTTLDGDPNWNGTIHDTFLDAYTPNGWEIITGMGATWADHYYHDEGGFDEFFANTDDRLWYAHNVDVTALIDQWDETASQRHKWPVRWYDSTVGNADPANQGYGFALSKEAYSDPDSWPPDLPPNWAPFKQVYLTPPQTIDPVAAYLGVSETGITDVTADYIDMVTASPVWVSLLVTTDSDTNYLEFDYNFVSDADGVLSVFLEDQLLGMFYERFSLDGEQGSGKLMFDESLGAGSYVLAFRVDPLTDDASSIRLSDVSMGYMSAVPEPPTSVLLTLGVCVLLGLRLRRRHTAAPSRQFPHDRMTRVKRFLLPPLVVLACVSLVCPVGCVPDIPTGHDTSISKDEPLQNGVSSITELERDGEYYLVTGADMHNLRGALIGKKIRFRGTVKSWGTVPVGSGSMAMLTEDKCYYVVLIYIGGNIPNDLREQIDKGGVQKGDSITLWCTVDRIAQESGPNRSLLGAKSCFVNTVDKWE